MIGPDKRREEMNRSLHSDRSSNETIAQTVGVKKLMRVTVPETVGSAEGRIQRETEGGEVSGRKWGIACLVMVLLPCSLVMVAPFHLEPGIQTDK